MQRRLIAAITAVILAGVGAILLFNYVATADTRAMAGQHPTNVLVVTTAIPAGTLGSQLSGYVEMRQLPAVAIVPGALTTLDTVATKAVTTNLQVGEQLITARFAAPGTSANGEIAVSNDKQLLTIQLEAQRILGGKLAPGDKVAVYVTVSGKTLETQEMLQSVQVVRVGDANAPGLITLALSPSDAQRVILAIEAGKVWLAQEAKNPASTTPLQLNQLVG
jgi:pilus assembly protein CpaB